MAKRIHIVEKLKRVFEEYGYEVKGDNNSFWLKEYDDDIAPRIQFDRKIKDVRQFTISITSKYTNSFAGGDTIPF